MLRSTALMTLSARSCLAIAVTLAYLLPAQPVALAEADEPAPAEQDRIELTSGDVLLGRIAEESDEQIVLEHPLLGRIELPRARIAEVIPAANVGQEPDAPGERRADFSEHDANEAPADEATTDEAPANEEPRSLLAELRELLDGWKLQLALGFSDRASNVRSFSVHTRLNANYADSEDRWRINAAYHRSTTDSRTTRNDIRLFLQKDWLLPESSWFFFGQGDYHYDTIKSWDHRLGLHGGVGYDLNELLGVDARLRGGLGFTREFGGVDPKTRPESLLATEFNLQLTEVHSVAGSVQFMPSIDGSGYYRVTTDGNWDIKLTEELSLRFGVQHEYDNAVPAGFEKHDRRLTGSLVFQF